MLGTYFELLRKNNPLNKDNNQVERQEIEYQINQLEDEYSMALDQRSDLHSLSSIWQRIKELKERLASRPVED